MSSSGLVLHLYIPLFPFLTKPNYLPSHAFLLLPWFMLLVSQECPLLGVQILYSLQDPIHLLWDTLSYFPRAKKTPLSSFSSRGFHLFLSYGSHYFQLNNYSVHLSSSTRFYFFRSESRLNHIYVAQSTLCNFKCQMNGINDYYRLLVVKMLPWASMI